MEDEIYNLNEFEVRSSINEIIFNIENNPDFYVKSFFNTLIFTEDGEEKLNWASYLGKAMAFIFKAGSCICASLLLCGITDLKMFLVNFVSNALICFLISALGYTIDTFIKERKARFMLYGLLNGLYEIREDQLKPTDKNIHELSQSLIYDNPYTVCMGEESKTPIFFEMFNIRFKMYPDYFVTRCYELTFHISNMAYPGYEEDIKGLYDLVYDYTTNKKLDAEKFKAKKDYYDELLRLYEQKCVNNSKTTKKRIREF